jgi:hypothetical protein
MMMSNADVSVTPFTINNSYLWTCLFVCPKH